jgi:hypothetical protein
MNARVEMLERRNKALAPVQLDVDPAKRIVLPADYYVDSHRPVLTRVYPTVPLQPTRIDFLLSPREMETVDFHLPDEPAIWEAWAVARVKREAMDAEMTGFSECITLEGSEANIRRVSHKTRRVMEQRDLLFRFAIDHNIDTPDPALPTEPPPVRIEVDNTMVDKIRADNAEARSRGVNQRARAPRLPAKRRSTVPWGYVAGLASTVVLLAVSKFLHIT